MAKWKVVFVLISGLLLTSVLNAAWISISPAALRPSDSLADSIVWHATPSEFYFETYAPYVVNVPLNLPDGVALKKFIIYVTDQSGPSNNIWVHIQRQSLATGTVVSVATITTMDLGSLTRAMLSRDLTAITVNNSLYSYSLRINFDYAGSKMKFHGARISY
ncbi:MAG: hypothetical protein MUQ00_00305 [Candidatus Aminicenantes bacterium]|nr:hypothetical protein [Candidatus Aminicenantes bacterium]